MIRRANQRTGFYIIGTFVKKELNQSLQSNELDVFPKTTTIKKWGKSESFRFPSYKNNSPDVNQLTGFYMMRTVVINIMLNAWKNFEKYPC